MKERFEKHTGSIIEEMRRRRLGEQYFQVGHIYRTNKQYRGIIKESEHYYSETGTRRNRVDIPKGRILLCTKNEMIESQAYSIIEFLFNETVIQYISDAWELCQVMDPMLPQEQVEENKAKEESHE